MPYEGKTRVVDAGPSGLMRLSKRNTQDRRAAVQPVSAIGGAPRRSPANAIAGQIGEEPMPGGVPLALPEFPTRLSPEQQMRYQPPAELEPIIPHLQPRTLNEIEKYTQTNPQEVRLTADYLRSMGEMPDIDPMGVFESHEDMAAHIHAALQRMFEPQDEPLTTYDTIHQSRDGRVILNFLRRSRQANIAYGGGPPLPGGK